MEQLLLFDELKRVTVESIRKTGLVYDADQRAIFLYAILKGWALVTKTTPEGKIVALDLLGPEDIFGLAALAGADSYGERVIAYQDLDIMKWRAEEILQQAVTNPCLGTALIQAVTRSEQQRVRRVVSMASDCVPEVIAKTLAALADKYGEVNGGGATVPPITHELLAEFAGTSRENVTASLGEFRIKGLLDYSRKGIQIPDVHRLRNYRHPRQGQEESIWSEDGYEEE